MKIVDYWKYLIPTLHRVNTQISYEYSNLIFAEVKARCNDSNKYASTKVRFSGNALMFNVTYSLIIIAGISYPVLVVVITNDRHDDSHDDIIKYIYNIDTFNALFAKHITSKLNDRSRLMLKKFEAFLNTPFIQTNKYPFVTCVPIIQFITINSKIIRLDDIEHHQNILLKYVNAFNLDISSNRIFQDM